MKSGYSMHSSWVLMQYLVVCSIVYNHRTTIIQPCTTGQTKEYKVTKYTTQDDKDQHKAMKIRKMNRIKSQKHTIYYKTKATKTRNTTEPKSENTQDDTH